MAVLHPGLPGFTVLADLLHERVVWFDPDGRYLFVNRAVCELWGGAPDDYVGRLATEIGPPRELAEQAIRLVKKVATTGKMLEVEYEAAARTAAAALSVHEARFVPVTDGGGNVVSVLAVMRDITDAKRKQKELEQSREALRQQQAGQQVSEDSLRAIADLVPVGIFDCDVHGNVNYANQLILDLHARVGLRKPGPDWIEIVHPDDRDALIGAWVNVITKRQSVRIRYRVLTPDENSFWIEAQYVPVLDSQGNTVRVIGSMIDVDREVEVENRLKAARDQALEASRLKSQFVANISHEIRTPLNGVIGLTSLLLEDELTPQQRELVATLRAAGTHLLDLLNDILDLSRIEAGELRIDRVPVDLDSLVEEVRSLFTAAAHQKNLQLRIECQPELPSFFADRARLRQITSNLVDNAIKFTEKGEVVVTVTAEPSPEAGSEGAYDVTVSVRDTGIGIAAADHTKIFEMFAQADPSSTRRFGGTGLGLAISRQLVSLMGGAIGVDSTPGEGSTFWFTIPLVPVDAAQPPSRIRAFKSDTITKPEQRGNNGRVLLVEDNQINQRVGAAILERLGYSVAIAADGREALDLLMRERFDAVLMDCQMPRLDGFATTRELRATPGPNRSVPVIALTAGAMEGDRDRCVSAGMDDYLAKPFTMAQLAESLQRRGVEPATKAASTMQLVDRERVDELRSLTGPEGRSLLHELHTVFLDTVADSVSTLRECMQHGDIERAAWSAHKLHGACVSMGATRAAATATAIAKACTQPSADHAAAKLIDQFEDELAATLDALAVYLQIPSSQEAT
ncbi:MAG: ATP-binding protein [Acidimicrobiales bacterium]|nr:ATP-binding protein [Acidimicrobiales bacterium]